MISGSSSWSKCVNSGTPTAKGAYARDSGPGTGTGHAPANVGSSSSGCMGSASYSPFLEQEREHRNPSAFHILSRFFGFSLSFPRLEGMPRGSSPSAGGTHGFTCNKCLIPSTS